MSLNIDEQDIQGMTKLQHASYKCLPDLVGALLAMGADPLIRSYDNNGFCALHFACASLVYEPVNRVKVLELLYQAIIGMYNHNVGCGILDYNNRLPLYIAVSRGHMEAILFLDKYDGWKRNNDGRNAINYGDNQLTHTPLHINIIPSYQLIPHRTEQLQCEIAKYLIDKGANRFFVSTTGITPEMMARKYGLDMLANCIRDYKPDMISADNTCVCNIC
jgi:ankyrin repeat protein